MRFNTRYTIPETATFAKKMLTTEQIKQTVAEYFKDKPVKKVYLFGSYARGEANENSDVDLFGGTGL